MCRNGGRGLVTCRPVYSRVQHTGTILRAGQSSGSFWEIVLCESGVGHEMRERDGADLPKCGLWFLRRPQLGCEFHPAGVRVK